MSHIQNTIEFPLLPDCVLFFVFGQSEYIFLPPIEFLLNRAHNLELHTFFVTAAVTAAAAAGRFM